MHIHVSYMFMISFWAYVDAIGISGRVILKLIRKTVFVCFEGVGLVKRFAMFNGGFSKKQLSWLDSVLTSADEKHEKVTIACKSH